MTASLVLETHNLGESNDGPEEWTRSLCALLRHLREQTQPLTGLAEVVITGRRFPPGAREALSEAAGRAITLVTLPAGADYYESKNLGFDGTTSGIVAFGDTDCWPDAEWLERLLAPFSQIGADAISAVAGRTTYRRDWLGAAASTIDFLYFQSPLGKECTRNFYANNVAFRREVFAANRYLPEDGVSRGHCQVLGLKLQAQGVKVFFEPRARTIHRFPDSAKAFLRLRLLRGQDTTQLTPKLMQTYAPRPLAKLLSRSPWGPLSVLGLRLGYSVAALGHQDMPALPPVERLKALLAIQAISALDTAGAMLQAAGLPIGNASKEQLAYRTNADALS